MEGLEVVSYDGEGWKPLVRFEPWSVAILNSAPIYERGKISMLEKHTDTDEVFVLLKGSCELLIAGSGETIGKIERVKMEAGQLYNVKQNVWHSCCLEPDTSLLIVETMPPGTVRVNLPEPV